MKVMVFVKASPASEADVMPTTQLIAAMMKYNEELIAAGILKGGDGLKSSKNGVRIQFSGDSRTVTNGPFAETSELVAGYWLWEVSSMEEAITWAKRCPNPMPDDSELEIRPLFAPEDFGDVYTDDMKVTYEKMQS